MSTRMKKEEEIYLVLIPTNDYKLKQLTDSVGKIEHLLKGNKKRYYMFYGPDIERKHVEKLLRRSRGRKGVIVYYGHGCKCGGSLYADYRLPLFDLDNVNLFKNKICYVAACHSSRSLGRKAVRKGCKAYLGYKDSLLIPPPNGPTYGVIESIHEGLRMIVEDFNPEKAKAAVYEKFADNVTQSMRQGNPFIPILLEVNMDHLDLA